MRDSLEKNRLPFSSVCTRALAIAATCNRDVHRELCVEGNTKKLERLAKRAFCVDDMERLLAGFEHDLVCSAPRMQGFLARLQLAEDRLIGLMQIELSEAIQIICQNCPHTLSRVDRLTSVFVVPQRWAEDGDLVNRILELTTCGRSNTIDDHYWCPPAKPTAQHLQELRVHTFQLEFLAKPRSRYPIECSSHVRAI